MDVAYVSAISALAGSVIGGLTTGLTTWLNARGQARAALQEHDLERRQDLVRDFIIAASKTYGDSLMNNEPNMQELVNLYAMVARMWVLSMPRTVACADKVMDEIVNAYFGPNLTLREIHDKLKNDKRIDPMRELSQVARDELQRFARL